MTRAARDPLPRPPRTQQADLEDDMIGDNDNIPSPDDGVYEAMAELDAMPAPMDVTRAVTRLRAVFTS